MTQARVQAGFSIIEVLAAMAIFGVLAAGLTSATVGTIKSNSTSRQAAAATALVQDKVEQLRAPTVLVADLTAGIHADARNPISPLGHGGGAFTRTWAVTRNSPKTGIAQVVVTVGWNGPEPLSVNGVSYVCQSATCS